MLKPIQPSFIQQLIFAILGCLLTGFAQLHGQPEFEHFTTNEGLSNNSITAMLQDHYGFLWLGTYNGLNRYDGYTFKQFPITPGKSTGLSSKTIYALCEDKDGLIWIGTNAGGLNKYNHQTEQFTHYLKLPDDTTSISDNTVKTIYEDRDGGLWIGTQNGLNQYDREKDCFIRHRLGQANYEHRITELYEDQSGILWIGTVSGLFYEDKTDSVFHPAPYHLPPFDSHDLRETHGFIEDHDQNLWFGTFGQGLYKISRNRKQITRFTHEAGNAQTIGSNTIRTIIKDHKNRLWVCTMGGGIAVKQTHDDGFQRIQHQSNLPNGLKTDNLLSAFMDRHQILWFGTQGGGLHQFNPLKEQFSHLSHDDLNENSLANNRVNCIAERNDGTFWFGTDNGLDHYDPNTHHFIHHVFPPTRPDQAKRGINKIKTLHEDPQGRVWIGTTGSGLIRFNPDTGDYVIYQVMDQIGLTDNSIFSVFYGSDHHVWIATYKGGLHCFNPVTETFTVCPLQDSTGLVSNSLRFLTEDRQGRLWIGTQDAGFGQYDKVTHQFIRPVSHSREPSSQKIVTLTEDYQGTIWVGTNNGLVSYHPESGQLHHFLNDADIPSNVIQSIVIGDKGYFWLSTDNGLLKFNPESGELLRFSKSDGLVSNQFIPPTAVKSRAGLLYFASPVNGVIYFDPQIIEFDKTPPQVMLTDISLFGKRVPIGPMSDGRTLLNESIFNTQNIELSFKDDILSFDFVALHFSASKENQYAYRLENFESRWNFTQTDRRATYTNLPPGRYTFRVQAANNHNIWSDEEVALNITIAPPFWQHSWFLVLAFLSLIGLIVLFIQWRTRTIQKRNLELQGINHELDLQNQQRKKAEATIRQSLKEKDAMLREIHHRVKNNLQIMQSLINLQTAQENDSHFDAYAGELSGRIQSMALIHEQLYNTENMAEINIREYITQLLNRIIQSAGRYDIEIKKEIDDIHLNIDQSVPLGLIINELLTNALKHAFEDHQAGIIQLSLRQQQNQYELSVQDNGRGIPEDVNIHAPDSLGLKLIHILSGQVQGRLQIESRQGTRFTVQIPV